MVHRHHLVRCSALGLILVAGCLGDTTPTSPVAVELLSAQRVNGVVGATFAVTTAGPTSISVPMCGRRVAASLERDSADVWVMVGGTVCPATLPMAPQVLVPGVPAGGTLAIGTLSSGRYRIGVDYSVYASRPVGPAVSGHAVSSAFDVR